MIPLLAALWYTYDQVSVSRGRADCRCTLEDWETPEAAAAALVLDNAARTERLP